MPEEPKGETYTENQLDDAMLIGAGIGFAAGLGAVWRWRRWRNKRNSHYKESLRVGSLRFTLKLKTPKFKVGSRQ